VHTIPGSAAHDTIPPELVLDGSTDRIAVVAAEEDDGCLGGRGREGGKEKRRGVERGMYVGA